MIQNPFNCSCLLLYVKHRNRAYSLYHYCLQSYYFHTSFYMYTFLAYTYLSFIETKNKTSTQLLIIKFGGTSFVFLDDLLPLVQLKSESEPSRYCLVVSAVSAVSAVSSVTAETVETDGTAESAETEWKMKMNQKKQQSPQTGW